MTFLPHHRLLSSCLHLTACRPLWNFLCVLGLYSWSVQRTAGPTGRQEAERHVMQEAHEMPAKPRLPCRALSGARACPLRAGCIAVNVEATGNGRKKRKQLQALKPKTQLVLPWTQRASPQPSPGLTCLLGKRGSWCLLLWAVVMPNRNQRQK